MRTNRIRLAVAASLLALGGTALHAGAVPPVPVVDTLPSTVGYCNLADLTGDVAYTPPIQFGITSQPVTWLMHLHFQCTGTGVYNGTYDLTVGGSGTESCGAGTGSGTVLSGAKTSGPGAGPIVSGQMVFRRGALHYYVSHPANGLDFTVQETVGGALRPYKANLWLDLPKYLLPNVSTDLAVTPPVSPESGEVSLPSLHGSFAVEPAPCIWSHDLTGHGFLGERYAVLQQFDDAVAEVTRAAGI